MERTFNHDFVRTSVDKAGYSFTQLADAIGVSVESVSKWLNGESVPRPGKVAKLGEFLGLSYDQMITRHSAVQEPVVAFRLASKHKATSEQLERGTRLGQLFEQLVPYLPFDKFTAPYQIKNPNCSYGYVNELGCKLRNDMGVKAGAALPLDALFGHLARKVQAVIVPVFWAHRAHGMELAAHIYSQRTHTTWIPLNLDTKFWDAKFWVAHELAHAISFTELKDSEESEKFADALAGTLVVPESAAMETYEKVRSSKSDLDKFNVVVASGKEMDVSPFCVAKQVDRFAHEKALSPMNLDGETLDQFLAPAKAKEPTLAAVMFPEGTPEARMLCEVTEKKLHSPFFSALSAFLKEGHGGGVSYIQALLDCSLSDARAINSELG
jgi:transcriptional regulator with XRE-family HTH domain